MDFSPCIFVEGDGSENSLIFFDFEKYKPLLLKYGGQGGGYSWESLVNLVLNEDKETCVSKSLRFDPEADMFSAVSSNHEDLHQVAKIIKKLTNSPIFLESTAKKVSELGGFA